MEPFYLSINQVNKDALEESDNSFHHVVCYDSEFKGTDSAKEVIASHNTPENIKREREPGTGGLNTSGKPQGRRRYVSEDTSVYPSKTFKAFTETVQALALQQSVIGKSYVTPATQEEIAKVIAETRKKLKKGVTFSQEVVCFDEGDGKFSNTISTNLTNNLRDATDAGEVFQDDRVEMKLADASHLERMHETIPLDEPAVDDAMVSNAGNVKKLIRIPPEHLKTERRQKSKLVWNINTREKISSHSNQNRVSELQKNILSTSFSSTQNHVALLHNDENSYLPQYSEYLTPYQQHHENISGNESVINIKLNEIVYDSSNKDEIFEKYKIVLKEKAHFEGRIDFLQQENKDLLHNRTELRTHVAELNQMIQNFGGKVKEKRGRVSVDDFEVLKVHKARLESVILDAHRLISEKDNEIETLNTELEGSRSLISKHENQVLESRTEIQSHEVTIRDMKSKITELYVEFQTTNQNRILFENEVQSLQGELRAALAAKDWYKEQLALCQKDKSELQAEMTCTKSEMIRQATAIEKLKAENIRTKLNLNEVEQKLLSEKLALARHLENIEAEMLEREALLMQSNKEYLTLKLSDCDVNQSQVDETDAAKEPVWNEQLIQCKHELSSLRVQFEEVSKCLQECQKKRNSLQDSVKEKEQSLGATEIEISTFKEEVGQLKLKMVGYENQISVLELEKAVLQVDLTSTTEEKKVIDESLMALKQNLKVVEANFHSMKVELINKSDEVDSLRKQLDQFKKPNSLKQPSFREIQSNDMNFLSTSSSSSSFSSQQVSHKTSRSTQTIFEKSSIDINLQADVDRLKTDKEDSETRLLMVTDQLKAAQERHKLQLNTLYGVERELETARNEIVELNGKFRVGNIASLNRDGLENTSAGGFSVGAIKRHHKISGGAGASPNRTDHSVSVVMTQKFHHTPDGDTTGKTHLKGLDSKDVKVSRDDDIHLDFLSYSGLVADNKINNTASPYNECLKLTSESFSPSGAFESSEHLHNTEAALQKAPCCHDCDSRCRRSLELESELSGLKVKLCNAERKTLAAEEQRNEVIFLEDQLDQVNQSRELDELRHKEEIGRLANELSSLESEVQRLQEEILLSKIDIENSTYRETSENFKNTLFEASKKKFYGARLFEHEDIPSETATDRAGEMHEQEQQHCQATSGVDENYYNLSNDKQHNFKQTDLKLNEESQNFMDLKNILNQMVVEKNQLLIEQEQLKHQMEFLKREEMPVERVNLLSSRIDQLSDENISLQTELVELKHTSCREAEQFKETIIKMELEINEMRITIHNERNIMVQHFALELEKEKGRLLELLNSQNALKEHATKLEENLANKECSAIQLGSKVHDELKSRELEIENLRNKIKILEENAEKGQTLLKEARKSTFTEKGINVKLKLYLEEMIVENKQLTLEVISLQTLISTATEENEIIRQSEVHLKVEIEKLSSDIKSRASEEERLRRELEDLKVKDFTLNDQIKTLEWKLSQKSSELEAANERIRLVIERQQCEVNSLTESLQTKTFELQLLQSQITISTRERSEMKARIVQFKQAITDILKQHSHASEKGKVSVNELILNKEEMEKLLVDTLPHSTENKPLSFLQATLSGLRGEINSLQTQVNEHATAVQTTSLAWKELEAQVQDLRQICRSSAASRAQSDHLMQETDQLIVCSLELPGYITSILQSVSSSSSSQSIVVSSIKSSVSHHQTNSTMNIIRATKSESET